MKLLGNKSSVFRLKGFTFRNSWLMAAAIILLGLVALFIDAPSLWGRLADNLNDLAGFDLVPKFDVPFRLGLDLQGGTHLIYQADLSLIDPAGHGDAMQGVRDVIERRVNIFGVAEPVIQINKSGDDYRLIVELAGIKDVHQAIDMIGQTPALDFREEREAAERDELLAQQEAIQLKFQQLAQGEINELDLTSEEQEAFSADPYFKPTSLTGRFLEGAQLMQDPQTYQWQVNLQFNDEGGEIFEELTKNNIGKRLAIYLDNTPVSAPVVQEMISGGEAQITGQFTADEAKELVQRLNAGALPVPIRLISQQTIGASLGKISLDKSLQAGIWGFALVLAFMIIYYRLPGIMASLALLIYIAILLALFKLMPVTLTLAGIAGFILSIGMAVDANVLIFERFKEELKTGRELSIAVEEGFRRAWPAIRDGNISTVLTCIILFIFATGPVKGFALTLGIGVLMSMFSAIIVTRSFMRLFVSEKFEKMIKIWR